ncbi:uncharacterized protein (TIGR03083 family) [Cellulomonas sp. PhB150]|nr:uncharacterized protein (TIGR03083 family) [Cellulomonas sp. PhB150]
MVVASVVRVTHPQYTTVIADESHRCADALAGTSPAGQVPACPEWTAADLAYHLGEVQDFWSRVVASAPAEPSDDAVPRPPDGELVGFLRTRTSALLDALAVHEPGDACWSWSPVGGDIAWVLRRQAHEALIHRVDAEQTAGVPLTEPAADLAADGVAEMLEVMVSGLPGWATFTPDGARLRLLATDADRAWTVALGRFTGTSPTSGTTYDEDCAELVEDTPEGATGEVRGTAWDLDLWLWGRGPAGVLATSGDAGVADRLRAIIVESSQ